ncbi:hypothetical protein C1J03_17310 [Sulfitobacter sp. SK012]|nr:hypothetical protein C1J03_17310 [Sulfitobacter sp. SK012]
MQGAANGGPRPILLKSPVFKLSLRSSRSLTDEANFIEGVGQTGDFAPTGRNNDLRESSNLAPGKNPFLPEKIDFKTFEVSTE